MKYVPFSMFYSNLTYLENDYPKCLLCNKFFFMKKKQIEFCIYIYILPK